MRVGDLYSVITSWWLWVNTEVKTLSHNAIFSLINRLHESNVGGEVDIPGTPRGVQDTPA